MTIQHVDIFENAACMVNPDLLFVEGAAQHEAKLLCRTCPVVFECLVAALERREEYGVWGGMTERERRKLLRSRPHVTSWRDELSRMNSASSGRHTAQRRPVMAAS